MFSLGRINTYNTPAKHSYKYGLGIMGRGRKKGSVHLGHLCGPCHLCQQSSTRYSHIITWDEEVKMQMKQLTGVSENDCICRACEGDFKSNRTAEGYAYRWMHDKGKGSGLSRCIVVSCNERDRIIHTGIASKSKVAELLHEEVLSEPRHLLTPMCESHYRQVHRLLHSDDHTYSDKRCHTCHALIRYCGGTARHCPNPAAVNQFFSMNGDNITERDYVCSSCYNARLCLFLML